MKRFIIPAIFASLFIIHSGEAHHLLQNHQQKFEAHVEETESSIIENIKTYIEIGSSAATILAVIVGGIWTYLLFIKKRQKFPCANVEHEISHFELNSDLFLIHVKVKITNIGNVLISLEKMETRIQQVSPIHDNISSSISVEKKATERDTDEILWPILDERNCMFESELYEIEPGEKDEFLFDFIIEKKMKIIEVYSYIKNIKKKGKDLGWGSTSIYDLKSRKEEKCH